MGLIRLLKKKLIIKGMDKRKAQNPFDVNYSDNYQLPADAKSDMNNSHYFSVHNFDTKECLYLRLARRGGDALNEIWFIYRDSAGNIFMIAKDHYLQSETLPATVNCVEAGKEFTFTYQGFVKPAKLTEAGYEPDLEQDDVEISVDATFTAVTECFEFSRHMSSEPMGRALSKEKFTKEFRAALSEHHQVHYEQSGFVSAKITFKGQTHEISNFPTIRDHSYGKRDWNYFDRYVWMVGLLENGHFIHTSLIRYPAVTEIQAGFYKWDGKTKSILSATSMDDLPVIGTVPQQFEYDVEFIDNDQKHVKCELDFVCQYVFGNGTYFVNEGVSDFNVDGVRGRGITEFAFNKDSSRWTREKKK